jgi:Fur family transcriptional regulator, ferric uptake regulator
MDEKLQERVRQKLDAFFSVKGLRHTAQRAAIIKAAFSTEEHFNAEDLLMRSQAVDPSVSRATVYRTITLLVESGFLRELDLGGQRTIYDPNFVERPTHNHLICLDCNRIIEFEDAHIDILENCITRRLGFSPATKSVMIEAHCDQLTTKGRCQRKPRKS